MKSFLNKHITFRQFAITFIILLLLEVILRSTIHATTVALLLPAVLVCMFNKLNLKPVKLKNCLIYTLPFIVATPFFIVIKRQTIDLYNNYQLFYFNSIVMALTYFILLIPVIIKSQKESYIGIEKERYYILIISALLLLINIFIVSILFIILIKADKGVYPYSSINLISLVVTIVLFIIALINAHSLWKTRGIKESHVSRIEEMEKLQKIVEQYFEKPVLYLDNKMTLNKFHQISKIPTEDLTCFFDNYMGMDFSNYLATYRINYAKELIINNSNKYTVESIAALSGYRSKTSFIKHFKQITGTIPSEYTKTYNNPS